ncbi:hypothetical protein AGMMS50267_16910 [Spirochaetia bacterium]|nr:hypothetical protein AGMMS49991_09960 [Spirochaetia bacterium]GHV89331.1 hypothetical protein AGMMS50267_16910 [Spirochaetia bacterium]
MTELERKRAKKDKRDMKAYFFLQNICGAGMALDVAASQLPFRWALSEFFLKIDEKLGKIFLDD